MPEPRARSFWEFSWIMLNPQYADAPGAQELQDDINNRWYYTVPIVGTGYAISDTVDALRDWKAMSHDMKVKETVIVWDTMGQILSLVSFDELNAWQEKYDELADAIDERITELNAGEVRSVKEGRVTNNRIPDTGLFKATQSTSNVINWQATILLARLELYRDLARSNQKILSAAMQASSMDFGSSRWWDKTIQINKMLAEQTILATLVPLLENAPPLDYTGFASKWGEQLHPENASKLIEYLGWYGPLLEQHLKNPAVLGPNAPVTRFYDPAVKFKEVVD